MPKDSRRKPKRFKKGWFLLGLICLGLFLFHKPLVLLGCKAALFRFIPKQEGRTVIYEKMQWEGNAIAISGIQIKDSNTELTIDRIEIDFRGSLLKFQPKISVAHPQIVISTVGTQKNPSLVFLFRNRFIQPQWEIKNGVLQLPSGGRFYFTMSPGDEKESIGDLVFSSDPNPVIPPMFSASLTTIEENLQVGFKLQESDLSRLLPLASIVFHEISKKWQQAGGEVQLEGLLYLDRSFQLVEMYCQGEGKQIALKSTGREIDVRCEEIRGAFSYPMADGSTSFSDKLSASLFLKNGNCLLGSPLVKEEFGIENLDVTLCFDPQKEAELVLNGNLLQQGRKIAFGCVGQGGIMHDSTFWSELELNSISSQSQLMQATASFCKAQGGEVSLHLQVDHADSEHLNFIRRLTGVRGHCLGGTATAAATFLYKGGTCYKTTLENCHLENMHWFLPETEATLFSKQISVDCGFTKNSEQTWDIQDLHLRIEEGDYLDPALQLNELAMHIEMDHRILQPSTIKGKCGTLYAEASLLESSGEHLIDIQIHGDGRETIARLSGRATEKLDSLPVDFQIASKVKASQVKLEAVGTVSGEVVKGSAMLSASFLSLTDVIAGNLPTLSFKEGELQAEHLTAKSYAAFIPMLVPGIDLSGNLTCEAAISSSRVELTLHGDDLLIQNPLAQLYLPRIKEKSIHFFYEDNEKKWQGEIPLADGKLNYRELDLSFENLEGNMKLDANRLMASSFYAECEGLALRGNLELTLENEGKGQILLSTSQMAGNVQNLFSVLGHFPSLPKLSTPIEGSFSSENRGFVLNAQIGVAESAEWSFKANFDGLKFPINEETLISDGHCNLAFDSKNQSLAIEKGEGIWRLIDGTLFTVQLKRFSTQLSDTSGLDFAFKVVDGKKEFAQLEGRAVRTPLSQWEIFFDKQLTYVGGTHLNITHCFLDDQMKLSSFEMRPILKCEDLHMQVAFLQNAGFLSKSFSAKNLKDWQFEGTMQTRLYSENARSGFTFHAESGDLRVRGKPWNAFELRAHKIGENWLIEHLQGGGLTLKGAFIVDDSELSLERFEGNWHGFDLKGKGTVRIDQKQFSCTFDSIKGDLTALVQSGKSLLPEGWKGSFNASATVSGDFSNPQDPLQFEVETNLFVDLQSPLAISGRNQKIIKFNYNQTRGLLCDGIELQFKDKLSGSYIAELKTEKITQSQEGELKFEKLQFSLSPMVVGRCVDAKILHASLKDLKWEGNLEGSGDLQLSSGAILQATLKPGRYGFGNRQLPFEQLQLRYENDLLVMRAKTQVEQLPLWGTLQVNLSKDPFGALKVFDHPKAEGLKILFSTSTGKMRWEKIQGKCYGIDCDLSKSSMRRISQAEVLTGSIRIDGHSLGSLLPQNIREEFQKFKIGNGYEWQGDLILWQDRARGFQASGVLSGSEFEFLGYQFQRLHANLEADPQHVLISELKLDDPAGCVSIKKIELSKSEKWDLYIPQVLVRQLQPSLMRKIGMTEQNVKPFTIKNFMLSEIRCNLKDKSSLEGSGRLVFANQFKKEASLFDLPFEIIKKIGLDPGLLTPVQGELEIELRGDKFYLLSLQNSFSEGDRAEFYLAPGRELSYIDLEGKVRIDLKMHQDVMLKITEPFTLTIRGTLEKPRYGLQY